ncbi:DNA-processing protein DprA [Lactiplantibacillus sp. WILCCON 0030]|uniref:DNA-processing protein DprA n=1 Tax=Lactiplantibacillus brownii TaxID=3069269 RepID=A0ABU1A923_9LACO|nr:DNA-processing protein DprA [Lactiplantibacillus brownii]MDQ7937419.1 DNA-processing protein DprA [Lactiplantibacillus brownii]
MQLRSLLIRLHLAEGIGYAGMTKVLHFCLRHQTVLTTAAEISRVAKLSTRSARRFRVDWQSDRFNQAVEQHREIAILTILDADYPLPLLESFQPPLVLFMCGQRRLLGTTQLAVVGARQASPYAARCVQRLLTPLAGQAVTIVSGLAQGTDSCAHRQALNLNLGTIAVIGTGLDVVYPRANVALQTQVSQVGLLISEYPLGCPPARHHFPERNRIIAGLCQAILVVEAREHSGSLITANLALQNNRNVLAVPGPIDAPMSVGCNQLILAGAKPVLNSRHIIEEIYPNI